MYRERERKKTYVYIYIYRERERVRERDIVSIEVFSGVNHTNTTAVTILLY